MRPAARAARGDAPANGRPRRDAPTIADPRPLDALVGLALAAQLAGSALAAALGRGWVSAAALDLIVAALLALGLARRTWRRVMSRLMLLGLVAGVLELATDAAGARLAHSLIYPAGEPLLWQSPVYMPLSWLVVLTLLGYGAWRLGAWLPRAVAMLIMALAAAVIIPFYEQLAYAAGWWRYRPVLPVGHVPAYVILFEGLIGAALPPLVWRLPRLRWRAVALRGALLGAWIACAALLAWLGLGR